MCGVTKPVLSHRFWSCSLWGSHFSRERSSYQCSIGRKLWKFEKEESMEWKLQFFHQQHCRRGVSGRNLKMQHLGVGFCCLMSQAGHLFWAVCIWVQFLCCFFHRTFIPWWHALSCLKLSIDTVSAFLGWNPGLCPAKNHVISKSGRFCIFNNSIPWYSRFAKFSLSCPACSAPLITGLVQFFSAQHTPFR